jgi:two-component system nitrogen regulation sensor histidine kinase NtrY
MSSHLQEKYDELGFFRWLPFILVFCLILTIVFVWPSTDSFGPVFLNWVSISLLTALAVGVFIFGVRKFNTEEAKHAGSNLRIKLVTAMVMMVLLPSLILQVTANQVIDKGFDVWFDVKVDSLLDEAMNLAQGFYADIESDMELSLAQIARDDSLADKIVSIPLGDMLISQHLSEILNQYAWHKVELFDASERILAVSQRDFQGQQLSDLRTRPISETGKLSVALGRHTIEHEVRESGEYVVGYLPLLAQRQLVALLRAEVKLPSDITASARSIEADYRTYRELERHRQGIQDIFMHTLMIAMISIVCIAGLFALFFARRLTAPVEDLALALKQVEAGDFDAIISVTSKDELGSLTTSFNSMTSRLKYNMDTLTQTQGELTDALVSSRQRQYVLENLLTNLQSGVILLDSSGEIRLMNETCQGLFMLPEGKGDKKSIFDFSEVHLKPVLEFFETLQTKDLDNLQGELIISYALQTTKILARGSLLGKQGAVFEGWLLVFDDITQLAEAQKHHAWSEVAQRLAHEIKTGSYA